MQFLLLLVGFTLLIKGADLFVEGSSSVAKKFHIPSMIIGLTIVAMGTSAPEAAVSISSSLIGQNDMSVANVVGSNIFNILIVLGMSTLINKLPVNKGTIKKDTPILIFVTGLLLLFAINLHISLLEGLIFLGVFTWFIYSMVKESMNNKQEESEDVKELPMLKTLMYIILGLVGIVFGGNLTVEAATKIAIQFGITENLIGLTIVAVGTSLPEFVTSILATKKGETDIAIGNVIGSNIFNILFVLGIASVISPMTISFMSVIDIIASIIVTILLFINMKKHNCLLNKHGMLYIIIYVGYILYTIIR